MFCNWLSRREGVQPCYVRASATELGLVWESIDQPTGYRMPTEDEFAFACWAGTGNVVLANPEHLIDAYAVPAADGMVPVADDMEPGASRLCNAWGLFDMRGNALEWCHDWFGNYPGGDVKNEPFEPVSARPFKLWLVTRDQGVGFRVALTTSTHAQAPVAE
jgi:formylglycine-generating enzyme required for sulfatase activity